MTRGLLRILGIVATVVGFATPVHGERAAMPSLVSAWASPSSRLASPAVRTLAAFDLSPHQAASANPQPQPPSDLMTQPRTDAQSAPQDPDWSIDQPMGKTEFLDHWQQRTFGFLWEQTDPETGLVADRAPADGSEKSQVASIAATGFALTGICIADQRDWISEDQAYQRVLNTLEFLYNQAPHKNGFFYHFMNLHTGRRVWDSEVSSVDTAFLMAGVVTAGQYYAGTEVETLAQKLYARVDWPWMLNGGRTLSMGWTPEHGFLEVYWDRYSEHLILQILGLGSPTHPLPPETWHAWRRWPLVDYNGSSFLSYPPLFVHQFSHAWIDFRGKRDDYADYWTNSVLATKAHRRMCIRLQDQFPKYGEKLWGITSSDAEFGYTAWGGPEPSANIDGTVVPCAAGGSMPFTPEDSIETVYYMYTQYGQRIWQEYGLVDAFNPHTNWAANDVIGIDAGIVLLMIENYRSQFVWNQFMQSPDVQRAMQIAGFRPYDEASVAANDQTRAAEAMENTEQAQAADHAETSAQSDNAALRNTSVFERILDPSRRTRMVKTLQVPRRKAEPSVSPLEFDVDALQSPHVAHGFGQPADQHVDTPIGLASADGHAQADAQPPSQWHPLTLGDALEVGRRTEGKQLQARFAFSWDDQALHLKVDVEDPHVKAAKDTARLYKQDLVELFVDPDNDGLIWNNPADFQFGFAVTDRVWEWFDKRHQINARVQTTDAGYSVKAEIPFSLLQIDPEPGKTIGASVAVQSINQQTHRPLKLNWSWQPQVRRIYLGQLTLADRTAHEGR